MISDSLERRIDQLNDRIKSAQDELNKLRAVFTRFPNLQVNTDKWGCSRYFTSEVNEIVNEVDIQYSYGCVIVRPLFVYCGTNIHSDPIGFWIANEGDYKSYDFNKNWKEQLSIKNINSVVIEKLIKFEEK